MSERARQSNIALIKGITESLRLLSLEAKRKQPIIRDAAERATLRLTNFLSRNNPMTSTTIEDALQPLLLTANHQKADPGLITIAISAIQRLLVSATLSTNQLQNVVRILRIQAEGGDANIQLRVLQTLPLLLSPNFFHSDDSLMATVVGIGFYLIASKDKMIQHTATGILRQSITVLFDNVTNQPELLQSLNLDPDKLPPIGRSVAFFFQDLCAIADEGEARPEWIAIAAHTTIPPIMALELVADILSTNADMLVRWRFFREIANDDLCGLLCRNLMAASDAAVLWHTMSATGVVLGKFMRFLPTQSKVLFSLLLRDVVSPAQPIYHSQGQGGSSIASSSYTSASTNKDSTTYSPSTPSFSLRSMSSFSSTSNTAVKASKENDKNPSPGLLKRTLNKVTSSVVDKGKELAAAKQRWRCVLVLETLRDLSKMPEFCSILYQIYDSIPDVNDALLPLVNQLADFVAFSVRELNECDIDRAASKHRRRRSMLSMIDNVTADGLVASSSNNNAVKRDDSIGVSSNRGSDVRQTKAGGDPAYMVLIATDCIVNMVSAIPTHVDNIFLLSRRHEDGSKATPHLTRMPRQLHLDDSDELDMNQNEDRVSPLSQFQLANTQHLSGSSFQQQQQHQKKKETPAQELQFNLVDTLWKPALVCLACIVSRMNEEEYVQRILKAFENFINLCSHIKHTHAVDELLTILASMSFPGGWRPSLRDCSKYDALRFLTEINQYTRDHSQRRYVAKVTSLRPKNIQLLKAQLNIAHSLGNQLSASNWDILLGVFEHLHISLSSQRQELEGGHFDNELAVLLDALERLFQSSCYLDDAAVLRMMFALRRQLHFNIMAFDDDDEYDNPPKRNARSRRRERREQQRKKKQLLRQQHETHRDTSNTLQYIGSPKSSISRSENVNDDNTMPFQEDVRVRMRRLAMSALGANGDIIVNDPPDGDAKVHTNSTSNDPRSSRSSMKGSLPTNGVNNNYHEGVSDGRKLTTNVTMTLSETWLSKHPPFAATMLVESARHNVFRLQLFWGRVIRGFVEALARGETSQHFSADASHCSLARKTHVNMDGSAASSGLLPISSNNETFVNEDRLAVLRMTAVTGVADLLIDVLEYTDDKNPIRGKAVATLRLEQGQSLPQTPGGSIVPQFSNDKKIHDCVQSNDNDGHTQLYDPRLMQEKIVCAFRTFVDEMDPDGGTFDYDTHDGQSASSNFAAATFQAIQKVVRVGGHLLFHEAWAALLNVITYGSQAGSSSLDSSSDFGIGKTAAAMVSVAFQAVSQILDDFLTFLSPENLLLTGNCLASFGAQRADVNIGLTAISMLLSLSDFMKDASLRGLTVQSIWWSQEALYQKYGLQHNFLRSLIMTNTLNSLTSNNSASTPGTASSRDTLRSSRLKFTPDAKDRLWKSMLGYLQHLSCDFRPSIRNSALQTLSLAIQSFYAVPRMSNAKPIPGSLWRACLLECLLPLLKSVQQHRDEALREAQHEVQGDALGTRTDTGEQVRMVVHHSRDTLAKQWNETIVIALKVTARVVQTYFPRLIRLVQEQDATASTSQGHWFTTRFWPRLLHSLSEALCPQHARLRPEDVVLAKSEVACNEGLSSMASSIDDSRGSDDHIMCDMSDLEVELAALKIVNQLVRFVMVKGKAAAAEYTGNMRVLDGALVATAKSSVNSSIGSSHHQPRGSSTASVQVLDSVSHAQWEKLTVLLVDVYRACLVFNMKVVQDDNEVLASEFFNGLLALYTANNNKVAEHFWNNARLRRLLNLCDELISIIHSRENTRRSSRAGMAMNFGRVTPSEKAYLAFLKAIMGRVMSIDAQSCRINEEEKPMSLFFTDIVKNYFCDSHYDGAACGDAVSSQHTSSQSSHYNTTGMSVCVARPLSSNSSHVFSKYTLTFAKETMQLLVKYFDSIVDANLHVPVQEQHSNIQSQISAAVVKAHSAAVVAFAAVQAATRHSLSSLPPPLPRQQPQQPQQQQQQRSKNNLTIRSWKSDPIQTMVGTVFFRLSIALMSTISAEAIAQSLETATLKGSFKGDKGRMKVNSRWLAATTEIATLFSNHFGALALQLLPRQTQVLWSALTRILRSLERAEQELADNGVVGVTGASESNSPQTLRSHNASAVVAATACDEINVRKVFRAQVTLARARVSKSLLGTDIGADLLTDPEIVARLTPVLLEGCSGSDQDHALRSFGFLVKLAQKGWPFAETALPALLSHAHAVLVVVKERASLKNSVHDSKRIINSQSETQADTAVLSLSHLSDELLKHKVEVILDSLLTADIAPEAFRACFPKDDAVADAAVRHGRLKCHLYYLSGTIVECLGCANVHAETRWHLQRAVTRVMMGVGLVDKIGGNAKVQQAF